jgi:hypothetical protein
MNIDAQPVDLRENMSVYKEQIFPAIVVKIEKTAASADIAGVAPYPGGYGYIIEIPMPAIVIQRLAFIGNITAEHIQLSVAIIVACGNAHSGHRLAVFVERDAAQYCFFGEFPVILIDVKR